MSGGFGSFHIANRSKEQTQMMVLEKRVKRLEHEVIKLKKYLEVTEKEIVDIDDLSEGDFTNE